MSCLQIPVIGILQPLIVLPAAVVAGHQRPAAAIELGLPTVPCIVAADMDAATRAASTTWGVDHDDAISYLDWLTGQGYVLSEAETGLRDEHTKELEDDEEEEEDSEALDDEDDDGSEVDLTE